MIKGFDSWEKFYADTREAENVANYSLTDEQKNLTYGDYYLTVQQDLLIIGYILPQEEVSPSMPPKDPEAKAEWEYEKELMEDSYSRGYRFGKAYSVVCPEGELGDKHVADIIMKISKADFEILKTDRKSTRLNSSHAN